MVLPVADHFPIFQSIFLFFSHAGGCLRYVMVLSSKCQPFEATKIEKDDKFCRFTKVWKVIGTWDQLSLQSCSVSSRARTEPRPAALVSQLSLSSARRAALPTCEVWWSDLVVFLWIGFSFVWCKLCKLYDDEIFCCWTMMLEMFFAALRSLILHMQDLLDQWDRIDSSWKTFKASRKLNELTTLSIDLEVGTPFCGKLERNNLKSRCLDVSQADKQNMWHEIDLPKKSGRHVRRHCPYWHSLIWKRLSLACTCMSARGWHVASCCNASDLWAEEKIPWTYIAYGLIGFAFVTCVVCFIARAVADRRRAAKDGVKDMQTAV